MDHYIDISDELFLRIQNHETTEMILPENTFPGGIGEGDVLKLYHSSDPAEALRVQVNRIEKCYEADQDALAKEDSVSKADQTCLKLETELLEWVFQIETELDEQLREEKLWLEGLL